MEKFSVERLVYDGSDPSEDWIITGIGHSKLNVPNLDTLTIESYNDYISKCPLHDNCLGHMCKTPQGVILPPQSLAIDTPIIRNDIARSASFAFQGSSVFHMEKSKKILFDSMKTKTGRMRHGILNCHVDGSLRMVITPHTYDHTVVFVPDYLRDKWKVPRLDEETQKYVSRCVLDGDKAIALRPPTLQQESVQPVTLSFWPKTCLGISPKLLKAFRGDYDGDEMHIYPVYSKEAIGECNSWVNTPNKTFDRASAKYRSSKLFDDESIMGFMKHTSVSFKDIRNGIDPPIMAEESRTKMEHITGLRKRFDTSWCDQNFIEDSIRGMADTNKQQLSQPIVGDMSRIARIAASCVIQNDTGDIQIVTEEGTVTMTENTLDESGGNGAIRGVSTICAASQQSALDSHRAKDDKLPEHDMINDLIVGAPNTLITINGSRDIGKIRIALKPQWTAKIDGVILCLCQPHVVDKIAQQDIIGAYNPSVLKLVATNRRVEVCSLALEWLVKYYSLPVTNVEIKCLAALYSYKPEAHQKPITTREGITARKLHWLDVTMANHYAGLVDKLQDKDIDTAPTNTASSALVAGNFRSLH